MEIKKVDPPFWFSGLQAKEFTLFVCGEGFANAKVSTNLPYETMECVGNDYNLIIVFTLRNLVSDGFYDFNITTPQASADFKYEFRRNRKWEANEPTISGRDVVYMLMPDRFAKKDKKADEHHAVPENPNTWHGGNIAGMTDGLGYLAGLGVTALWHTPVFKNSAYHGYSITDFYNIDEHFGSIEEYILFVQEAHRNGMAVVMDVVFNHCSIEHPWIKHPPTDDWFNGFCEKERAITNYKVTTIFDAYASMIDRKQTVVGWFTKDMPDLNLKCREVLCYLGQMVKWWIEVTGIDAIRMDTYLYSDLEAMIKWQNDLSNEYPNFSVIAETWVPEAAYTSKIQNDVYGKLSNKSSFIVMDFAFQKKIEQYLDRKVPYDKESSLYYHFVYDYLYSDAQNTLAFLDNHDLPRWFDIIKSKAKLKQALGILLTVPRIPQIYYGTEFMVANDGKRAGDGSYRVDTFDMIKNGHSNEIIAFLKKVLQWRKSSKAIAQGTMKHFVPQSGVYVYFRGFEGEKVMVLSNISSRTSSICMRQYEEELDSYVRGVDVITGTVIDMKQNEIQIKQNEILILNLLKS